MAKVTLVDFTDVPVTTTLPLISAVKDGFPITVVRVNAGANAVTVQRSGSDTIGGDATTSVVLTERDQAVVLIADAANANWVPIRASTAASALDTPTFTGLTTVAGVKVASGTVSGQLAMAEHSGGVFVTLGNVICPNEAGFSVTLIAGGTHTVRLATGPSRTLNRDDMFTLAVALVGDAHAVHTLSANVIHMAAA